MDYKLRCVGFPTDSELKEQLLLTGRKFLVETASKYPVRITVKQIDGLVQSRVDVILMSRRISAFVSRRDAVESMEAAMIAIQEVFDSELDFLATGTDD